MMRAWICILCLLAACAGTSPDADNAPLLGDAASARTRARAHTELAALYVERGNLGVALEELRIATAADSSYAPAHTLLGLVYAQMKDNDRARDSFRRALRVAPEDADANHNFGWFLCQSGEAAQSLEYFAKAVRNPLYPTPWRSYSTGGLCALRAEKAQLAEEYFVLALRSEPDEATSLLQLGHIRYRQSRLEEARRLVSRFNRVVEPTSESLWLALRVERRLGERVAESALAGQLRRRFPDSREYRALQRSEYD